MKKIIAALTLVVSLSACGAAAEEENYYDNDSNTGVPATPEPEKIQQDIRLKVDTYGGADAEITKVVIDGTPCVIFTTYEGGSAMSCDWS